MFNDSEYKSEKIKKITYRSILRKYCLESTILGLKYFYLYPDCISRCFWAANMVAVSASACILTMLLYYRFVETPTRTTIESQQEPLRNLPFPAITICSPNQVTISFMKHFNRTLVDGDLNIDLYSILPKLLGFYVIANTLNEAESIHFQSLLDQNRHMLSEVMGAMPQTCESFLKNCIFEQVIYPNCKTLFKPILTPQGLCCTFNNIYHFNNKRNIRSHQFTNRYMVAPDIDSGLIVITDYQPEDSLEGTLINSGTMRVIVSDSEEFPYRSESVLVEPNTYSLHVIKPTYTYTTEDVKALPVFNRNCYYEHEKTLKFFKKYHQTDCELECYLTAMEQQCGCLVSSTPYVHSRYLCNVSSIACIIEINFTSKRFHLDKCNCLPECEFREYKVDMAIGNLRGLPHMLNKISPFTNLTENSAIFNFFFTKTVYVMKKQETVMSLSILFANLGGVFGLCLGCSCISVVELLFYIYVAIRKRKFVKRFNRRNKMKLRIKYIEFKH